MKVVRALQSTVVPMDLLPNRRKTLRIARDILRFRTGGDEGQTKPVRLNLLITR
jgi:hypothetical protein